MKDLEHKKLKQAQTFYNQDYWGVLLGPDIKIYQAGSLSSGQLIKIYLEISNQKIIDIRVQVYGGPYLIIAAGYFCEFVLNKNFKEILEKFSLEKIWADLNFPEHKKSILLLLEDILQNLLST